MSLIAAYATAAEADVILSGYADWLALTDAQKDEHLSWGRVYIDSEWACAYDETDATDGLKHANALLGYVNFKDALFSTAPSVKSQSVAAGSVSSSKTYAGGYKTDTAEARLLRQAELLLNEECVETGGGNLSRV